MTSRYLVATAALIIGLTSGTRSSGQVPTFDAASIKLNTSGDARLSISTRGRVYTAVNAPLRTLVLVAALAGTLPQFVHRRVFDETGLSGPFDFELRFSDTDPMRGRFPRRLIAKRQIWTLMLPPSSRASHRQCQSGVGRLIESMTTTGIGRRSDSSFSPSCSWSAVKIDGLPSRAALPVSSVRVNSRS